MPSRYLASFSLFLKRHESQEYVRELLEDGFRAFIRRNVLRYDRPDLPLAAVGSVAAVVRGCPAFRSIGIQDRSAECGGECRRRTCEILPESE